ncbi:hypothetical protein NP71_06790 [Staphylococcus schleiferi]|nr:hypothetical protein NP71_06790 [Staphylococcus schleiferi]
MAMSKQEAVKILQKLDDLYDMGFASNKQKSITWLELLMRDGNYQLTLTKIDNFIKQSKYKPTIADILAIKPKEYVPSTPSVEKTHQYKLRHDSEYAKEWENIKRKGHQFIQELRADD